MGQKAANPSRHGLAWLRIGLPVLGLALIAGLWMALWLTLRTERTRVEAQAVADTRALAHAFESHTHRALRQVDLVTQFLAYEFTRQGRAMDLLGVLREGMLRQPGVLGVALFDARGDRISSTSDGPSFNVADREHFKIHQENRHQGLFVSPPLLSRGGVQQWLVFMTRRLQTTDGQFAGTVIVSVDSSYFTSFYNESQFGKRGLISLVGLDWVVRARRSGDKVWFGETAGNNYLVHQIQKAPEGSYRADSKLDGVQRFLSYKVLPDYPLVALVGRAEEEVWAANAQWESTLLKMGALATVLLGAAFAAMSGLARRIGAQHAELADAHARFAAASDAKLDAFLILRAVRDTEGRIVDFRCEHCNDRALAMIGVSSRERVLALTRGELLGPQGDPRFFDTYCRVTETRRAEEGDFLMTQSASGQWLHHQVVPVEDGVAVTSRDVTALHQHAQQMEEARQALQASAGRLSAIAEHIPALVAYLDREQRFRFANQHYMTLLGVDPKTLLGRRLSEVRGPDIYERLRPHVEGALRGERQAFEAQGQENGKQFNYQYHYVPDVGADGGVVGFFALGFDVTAVRQAERRQQESEQRLRAITDNLPVLIAYVDADERVEFCNQTCLEWMGLDPQFAQGKRLPEVWGAALYAERSPHVARALRGERVDFESEREALGVTRCLQNTYLPDVGADGHVKGVFMLSSDVTQLKLVERQLTTLARFDSLTGLANRHQFNEKLADALARAQRSGEALALMFLDIDHFKSINDTFGHAAGDSVLREFAHRLRQCVRGTDTVARLAGDEFVIILEGVHSEAEPQFVARKIVGQVNRPFDTKSGGLEVTTSVGIAFHRGPPMSPEELLARADKALYTAKAQGRNTYHLAAS
jgi:diguanylate cyclase (GGDEF)-like protein/PAS domain S-box-containing protein